MIRYLADPANAITAAGLICSSIALQLIIVGQLELGIAVARWAMVADQFDGIVARRMKGRADVFGQIGKNLDGNADLLYGAVIPAVTIVKAANYTPAGVCVSILLLIAGALRLSCFSVFGMPDGKFIGLPLSYDVPILALLLLARSSLPDFAFVPILLATAGALGVAHVSPLSVPAPKGLAYVGIAIFAIAASAALAIRAASPLSFHFF